MTVQSDTLGAIRSIDATTSEGDRELEALATPALEASWVKTATGSRVKLERHGSRPTITPSL